MFTTHTNHLNIESIKLLTTTIQPYFRKEHFAQLANVSVAVIAG